MGLAASNKYGWKRNRYKIRGNKDYFKNIKDNNLKEYEENNLRVKDLGGLCIIGTERHESRRIDNQLRGRSEDRDLVNNFISLQDELMRILEVTLLMVCLKKLD